MKRLSAAVLLYLGLATAALAQTTFTMPPPAGVSVIGVQIVSSCGGASLTAGGIAFVAMDTTGKLCDNGGGGGGSTTANQGTANTLANAWPTKITDGTNGPAAVKPASTAAAATDPGLVVDISPNGINPNGSNTSALSAPVVIASDQAPVAVKGSGPAVPTNSLATVSAGFTYTHISTSTTTAAIKTGAGVLHTVCVNTLGTVASAITVDDALTATTPTIAIINSLTLLGCQTYDVAFSTGLTVVTTGTVAPDVTVSWR